MIKFALVIVFRLGSGTAALQIQPPYDMEVTCQAYAKDMLHSHGKSVEDSFCIPVDIEGAKK